MVQRRLAGSVPFSSRVSWPSHWAVVTGENSGNETGGVGRGEASVMAFSQQARRPNQPQRPEKIP